MEDHVFKVGSYFQKSFFNVPVESIPVPTYPKSYMPNAAASLLEDPAKSATWVQVLEELLYSQKSLKYGLAPCPDPIYALYFATKATAEDLSKPCPVMLPIEFIFSQSSKLELYKYKLLLYSN